MRLPRRTNLPGVSTKQPRTAAGAQEAIRHYEEQNQDLDTNLRRLLAIGATARFFGRKLLEEATQTKLPQAPFRDWSWRWWTVLQLSGLSDRWEDFISAVRAGGVRAAATMLRVRVTPAQYSLFLRRAGTNPHNDHRPRKAQILWTKGGCWDVRSPLTRLLVLGQPVTGRRFHLRWQKKLGQEGCKRLERELLNLIDPNKMLVHEAKLRAIDYVRRRIPEMIGTRRYKNAGPKAISWFFNFQTGRVVKYKGRLYAKRSYDW